MSSLTAEGVVNLDKVRKWAICGLLAGLILVLIIYAAQPERLRSLQ